MNKVILWSIVILLALLLFFAATIAFSILFQRMETDSSPVNTPAAGPTFTPVSDSGVALGLTATPRPVDPTFTPEPTATAVNSATDRVPTEPPVAAATETPVPIPPTATPPISAQVVAATAVNIRQGPGTNFAVIATLPPYVSLPIVGRNGEGTWWKIQGPDGSTGWVANSVVQAGNTAEVPVVIAPTPPPPPPAVPTPVPQPTTPTYQYEPTGWFDDTNYGLTRFLGSISDVNGNPVNGVRVEAQCGSYRVISNPSGPVGAGVFNESADWPPGFYDITLDTKPVPCNWVLTVVESPDGETVTAVLSERIEVEVTYEKSIITANWRKNY